MHSKQHGKRWHQQHSKQLGSTAGDCIAQQVVKYSAQLPVKREWWNRQHSKQPMHNRIATAGTSIEASSTAISDAITCQGQLRSCAISNAGRVALGGSFTTTLSD